MGEENPGGVLEQFLIGDHGETDEDAAREADIDGENVDVVCGAPAMAISGFVLQGFIFSQIDRKKRLEGHTLSEGVIDIARPPQCEFSTLQNLSLIFLRNFCRPIIDFC